MRRSVNRSTKSKRKSLDEKLKRLAEGTDKPVIENFSSDSDEASKQMKDFNATVPRLKRKMTKQRPGTSAKSALKFRKTTVDDLLKLSQENSENPNILGKRQLFKDFDSTKFKWKEFHDNEKSHTSKSASESLIENVSSEDDLLDSSPPETVTKPTIENFDDEDDGLSKSPVIIPCSSTTEDTRSSSVEPQISQGSSENNSQVHRFNTRNIHKVKVKPSGLVEKLLKAISEGQQENIQWDFNTSTPFSQTEYFTVSHFEKVLGSMMIFFMLNDQKCAIFIEPTHKIVGKLKIGSMFAFVPDHAPYESQDGVKVYVGLTKIKFVH